MARALILEAEALEAKERPQPRKVDRKSLENLKPRRNQNEAKID
jgi:hypothetical protein